MSVFYKGLEISSSDLGELTTGTIRQLCQKHQIPTFDKENDSRTMCTWTDDHRYLFTKLFIGQDGIITIESMNCKCVYTAHMREHTFSDVHDNELWRLLEIYTSKSGDLV